MGKLKDHLNKLAFRAIGSDKPQFLGFCLSTLRVDKNATMWYERGIPIYGFGRRKAKIDLVQYAVHKKRPECLEVLLEHGANVYPSVENFNNDKFAPPLYLAMDEHQQQKRDEGPNFTEYVTSKYKILTLLLRYVFHLGTSHFQAVNITVTLMGDPL